jgi:hypothetical protein
MKKDKIIAQCRDAVGDWTQGSTIVFHPEKFKEALFIREYMESFYPNIDIFIVCKGFIYGTELKDMGE